MTFDLLTVKSRSVGSLLCWIVATVVQGKGPFISVHSFAPGQVDLVVCKERDPGGSRLLVENRWNMKIVVLADTRGEGSQQVYEIR